MSPMLNLLKTHKVQRMLVDFSSVLFINTYHKLVSGYNQTEQMFYYQSPSTFRCVIFPSCFIHFFHNCSLLSRVSSPPPCIILRLCVCARLIVNLRRPPLSERVKWCHISHLYDLLYSSAYKGNAQLFAVNVYFTLRNGSWSTSQDLAVQPFKWTAEVRVREGLGGEVGGAGHFLSSAIT